MADGDGTHVTSLVGWEVGGVLFVNWDHAGGTEGKVEIPRETTLDDMLGEPVKLVDGVFCLLRSITVGVKKNRLEVLVSSTAQARGDEAIQGVYSVAKFVKSE